MTFKVFISSSVRDIGIVEELRETLERYGITSITSREIPINVPIEQYLRHQIHNSDCFLAIIGRGGSQSENVNFELGIATSLNRPVIPVVEEGSVIPQNLANRQYILINRDQPRLSYENAAKYLKKLEVEKETRNAIGGLILLGLGLLLLGALFSSD